MANIFTIKVGSPNLLNSPLLDGELGFHLTNNTLYIGSSSGAVPIGGAGAFVPFNEDKTISVKGLTLTDPLQPEYGGTGTTDLSTLTFVTNQITDLNEQGFLKKENLEDIGFSENEGIWGLDIDSLKMGGAEVATRNWVDGKGYLTSVPEVDLSNYYTTTQIDSMLDKYLKQDTNNPYIQKNTLTNDYLNKYLPLSGGTITNTLTVNNSLTAKNQLFLTNTLNHSVDSGAVQHLFSSKTNTNNSGQIFYYGETSHFGFEVNNANGNNGANARVMFLCSKENQSSFNNFIRVRDYVNGTYNTYDVYHSGWSGTMSFPTDISVVNTIQMTRTNDVAIKFIKGSQNAFSQYTGNYIEANDDSLKLWTETDYQNRSKNRRGLEIYNQTRTTNDGDALVFHTCDSNGSWNNYKVYHEGNLNINYKIAYGSTTIKTSEPVTIYYSSAKFTSKPHITASYSTDSTPGSGDNGAIKIYSKTTSSAQIIVGGNTLADCKIDWIAIGV